MAWTDYLWLVSSEARPWLEAAADPSRSLVSLTKMLRKSLDAQRTHLVLEQVELRRRAEVKFPAATEMFFTRQGLEQSTDDAIATYKARRIPANRPAADLCCGIGGDLLQLAERGRTVALDRDPITTLLATANCEATGRTEVELSVVDVAQFDVGSVTAWHIDPDRRADGRRRTRLDGLTPGQETIEALLERNGNAAIKLAPATEIPRHWATRGERQWIGSRSECRQQVVWLGELAGDRMGETSAAVVFGDRQVAEVRGTPATPCPVAKSLGDFVFDLQPAVWAAQLDGALAAQYELQQVSPGSYLTGNRPIKDKLLSCFQLQAALPLDIKRVKSHLRNHKLHVVEIKQRGVDVDPSRLAKQLAVAGETPISLLVTRHGGTVMAMLGARG